MCCMDSHSSVAFAPGNVRSTCDAAQSIADGRCFSTARPYATYIESIIFAPPFVMAPPAPNAFPTEKRLAELNSLKAPPLEAASAATAPEDSRAMFTVKNAVVAATKTIPPVIRPTATTKWSDAISASRIARSHRAYAAVVLARSVREPPGDDDASARASA